MLLKGYRIFCSFVFSFLVFDLLSQINLVPNPGFETYNNCPFAIAQLENAEPWFRPNVATPDYFNACASPSTDVNVPNTILGLCPANTGSGYSGILLIGELFGLQIYREYLGVKLKSQLVNNQKYYVTFFYRLADSSRYASDKIGVYFGDTLRKSSSDTLGVSPQVNNAAGNIWQNKTAWLKFRASFISNGTEKFMYIGNFKHPFTNDTFFVNGGVQFKFPYYFIDDVCVSTDSLFSENFTGLSEYEMPSINVFPNPNKGIFVINTGGKEYKIEMYNLLGIKFNPKIHDAAIDIQDHPAGIYFLFLYYENKNRIYKIIKE